MFGSMPRGVNAYAKVGLETSISAASPHQLIVMLYDGALAAIRNAGIHMTAGRIAEKGVAVSKALSIIDSGLRASLDRKAGGDIAANLDALYAYMSGLLLSANLHNKAELLDEVQTLLIGLRDTWTRIGEQPATADAPSSPVTASA